VDPLAVVGSSISGAGATTSTSHSTTSSRAGAEFVVRRSRAGTSKEVTTLSLTPEERISIAVVSNIPTSRFEESEGEFGNLHLDNEARGHSFVGELSSFEVGTSST